MIELYVCPGGLIQAIYSDDLQLEDLGRTHIFRASHVEPHSTGGWTADMSPSGGGIIGPFDTRGEALAAEVAWLQAVLSQDKPLE